MALNYVFIFFFLIAFVVSVIKLVFLGDTEIFNNLVNSTFDMSKTGFEISLYLTGVMTLWLGLMKVGEKAGLIQVFSKIVAPFFSKLFPDIPKNHPVMGSILMNFSANMLGLDNAATPLGLKAMNELQELNPEKEKASNSQIMFLVLNTSGLTLIPISIMVYRAQQGAANPSDVFIPILLTTFFSTLAGLITVSIYQKINLFNKTILSTLGTICLLFSGLIYYTTTLAAESVATLSSLFGNFILFSVIVSFLLFGFIKKINVYETFIEGAKEGFSVSIKIIPYLVGILVAIGVFRTSGAMDIIILGISSLFDIIGLPTDFVGALPTAFMKPLSGSGARGLMVEAMNTHGADSFVGRLSCVLQGSTETTFYVLAVYFGSVGIRNTRHALNCGLTADFVGIIVSILLSYVFFM